MSDPKRLLHTRELGELGKSALGAAVELEPPQGARERVWTDLGAKLPFAGDALPDVASEAGGAGLSGAAGGAAATGGVSALGVTLAKVTGGLVALGAIATGGAVATGAFDASPPMPAPAGSAAAGAQRSNSVVPPAASPSEPESQAAPAAAESASGAPEAPTPSAMTTQSQRVRTGNGHSPPAPGPADVAPSTASFPMASGEEEGSPSKAVRSDLIAAAREESRLVGSAREALRAGDARTALALLAQARERFPAGVLGQERAALGIEASMQSGARAEAAESARRFLAAFPNSPHAARVRALVAATP